jgi:MSHA biogenesis protein MshK
VSSRRVVLAILGLLACLTASGQHDGELFDPTRPPRARGTRSHSVAASFELTAILISGTRRVAIINGKPCRAGDTVDGAELLSIESGSVELRAGPRRLTVHLRTNKSRDDNEGASPE